MNRVAFATAVLAAGALILAAPFISRFRNLLRTTFPDHSILILALIVGASVAAAVAAALVAIRERRPLRFGLIAAALAIGASYSLLTSSDDPHVAAVERFHFVQYGLITFLFYRAWRPLGDLGVLVLPVVAAMQTAVIEEWFQWFIPGRVGVMRDVLLNWVAIGCGLLFSLGFDPPPRLTAACGARSLRHVGVAGALFVLVFGLFFDAVHLGHEIRDPRIGTFASIYTEPELRAHAADRAVRWETDPPIDRTRLAREDQYRTEGIQHVQARNEAWARGDYDIALREQQILETYYAPVLQRGHDWPAGQRADAVSRAGAAEADAASRFVSRAYPYTVYTWPRVAVWAVVLPLAAALLALWGSGRESPQHSRSGSGGRS